MLVAELFCRKLGVQRVGYEADPSISFLNCLYEWGHCQVDTGSC